MARAARAQGTGLSLGLRRGLWLVLGLYLLLSLYVLWRSAVLTPYSDEIDWVARWYAFQASGDWRAYLFAPVNFHRIPLTFGLIHLDIQALHGTNLPLIASGALSLAVMAGALAIAAARAAPTALKLPAAAMAAMLSLMAGSVLDAATPICVNYTHGAVLAVLAILAAEGAEGPALAWRGPLALVLAMAAGLGDAAALAVWPVLALGALRRRSWIWLGAVLLVGGVFGGAYLSGQTSGAGTSTLTAFQHPASAVQLVLSYLLLPWTRLLLAHAWIGGLLLATVATGLVLLRGGRDASAAQRTACGLIAFTLVTALMAGLGRTGLSDPANVPLRYAPLVTPLHVGLLMLGLPWLGELWRANRTLAQALIVVLVLGLAAQDLLMAAKVIRAGDINRNLVADFKAGLRDPAMQVTVHPDPAHARAVYARLAADGRFQHELHLKPRPAAR